MARSLRPLLHRPEKVASSRALVFVYMCTRREGRERESAGDRRRGRKEGEGADERAEGGGERFKQSKANNTVSVSD